MLRCKDCGNVGKFYVGAKEYHTWLIDNKKNFLSDVECGDSDMSDDYRCAECDSFGVEEFSGDLAEHDLFECVYCGETKDIEDSFKTEDGLICEKCENTKE